MYATLYPIRSMMFQTGIENISDVPLIAQLGLGGVLAGIIFYFYRQDSQRRQKRDEEMLNLLSNLFQDNSRRMAIVETQIAGLIQQTAASHSYLRDDRHKLAQTLTGVYGQLSILVGLKELQHPSGRPKDKEGD